VQSYQQILQVHISVVTIPAMKEAMRNYANSSSALNGEMLICITFSALGTIIGAPLEHLNQRALSKNSKYIHGKRCVLNIPVMSELFRQEVEWRKKTAVWKQSCTFYFCHWKQSCTVYFCQNNKSIIWK